MKGLLDDGRLQVVAPIDLKDTKTKSVAAVYSKWDAPTDSILLVDKIDANFGRASRNISNVLVRDVQSFNTYEALNARRVFVTPAALEQLTARVSKSQEN